MEGTQLFIHFMKAMTFTKDYKRPSYISRELGVCKRTVLNRISEIEKFPDRYGDAVIRDGNIVLVDIDAYMDYIQHRAALNDNVLKKYVPEYNRKE